ncbi:DNA ligase [Tumebacillus flagellatus]|uniref:ATP-dependent DNA ligase n=1 Tax=Tumebacillus flagellatus TaxID=1157490 RepID=UPI001EE67D66|nr:DNA ligase [Tumebacillus flagellatus]
MENHWLQPISPMLASFGEQPFDDENYWFDVKWGRHLLLHKQGGRVEAYTRFGRRVTEQLPETRDAAEEVRDETVVLACEGIVLQNGRPVFDAYLHRLRLTNSVSIQKALVSHPVTFVALDVLISNGREQFQTRLQERKVRLREMCTGTSGVLMVPPYLRGEGKRLYAEAKARGLEGIVAKRVGSLYTPNLRSKDWIKIKVPHEIDCLILGYRPDPPFALVLGLHFPTVPAKPVGTVEQGITPEEAAAFTEIAARIHIRRNGAVQEIQPRLCCRVQYRDITEMHQLRQTAFHGFLVDKNPEDCCWHGG